LILEYFIIFSLFQKPEIVNCTKLKHDLLSSRPLGLQLDLVTLSVRKVSEFLRHGISEMRIFEPM
jgi:hypothetical protein